jgi:phytoene dehydrogenase-like protein
MVGTPLTHQRFRRRYRGAYGGVPSGEGANYTRPAASPQAVQAMKGLYCCGDCVFPWIGTPAVAASGAWVANTFAPVWAHWNAVNKVER